MSFGGIYISLRYRQKLTRLGRGVYPIKFLGFCRSHIFTDFDYADPTFSTYSIIQTSSLKINIQL